MEREKDFSYFAIGVSLSYKRRMFLGKDWLIDFKNGVGKKRKLKELSSFII